MSPFRLRHSPTPSGTTRPAGVVLCAVVALLLDAARGDVFLLGYLTGSQRRPGNQEYSRPGLSISGAITLAVEEVNTLYPLRNNHTLDFVVAETYGEEALSVRQTILLWTKNVSAYMGPQETCLHEGRVASSLNIPMISYFCTRYETSDKKMYDTFARTRPPDTQISKSVASVLLTFNWRKITFLHSKVKDTGFEDVARTILKTLGGFGIEVKFIKTWNTTYHHKYMENPFPQLIDETYMESRIYVILGQYYEHLGLMISMQEKGLFKNGEYFVVGVDLEQYEQENPGKYLKGLLQEETEEVAKMAYQSYVGVIGSPPTGFDNFTVKVNAYMEMPPFNFVNPLAPFGGMKRIRAEAAYLYDAVRLYAAALNDTLADAEFNDTVPDGRTILKYIIGRTYKSAMGYTVCMDENGDAEGNYTLIGRRSMPLVPEEYGIFPVGVFQLNENLRSIPVLRLISSIDWIAGSPPVDEPSCGFRGEKCFTYTGEISACIAGVAFVLIIASLIIYRNWKYEQELDSLLWKIDYKDVQVNEYTPTSMTGRSSRNIHSMIGTSQVSLSSNPDSDFRYSTIYTQIGTYKGRIFAIKKVKKKHIDITRKMKKDLKALRDLRYDNLNAFIGACIDPPYICIITEYCTRGSLKDIIENSSVKLDNMFISSLVGDIIRGMIYLHDSPIKTHGDLRTSKCLVDSRWVLKIADFGMVDFKTDTDSFDPTADPQIKYEALLYTAPELLRNLNAPPCGSQKGDVYSFALILYEIHGRRGPYGPVEMTPAEIIKFVMNADENSAPFRPQLELLENPFDCVRECLKVSWSENPEERPDFKMIRHRLRSMRKGMKPNIFDNMIAMMEKYANNLEGLIDERTDQLMEEKKKTEALLYEMLPRYVAEKLKHGHKVEAESFDTVTIYFSDIVGFTAMSAESTPLQVVDFLNDLYTCFDSIIENYDVYKVETIGDAYMCVSGLPIRNGDQHAGEIASMSLSLLEGIRKFKIRHRPNDTLMLRIGIHSGPVCAGVVGSKMPRYCLFGDTVNTSSRMESNGLPLKIHCSQQCRDILVKLGGYYLEERGIIKMKGKGELRTYWLVGEDLERKLKQLQKRNARQLALQQIARNALTPCFQRHSSCYNNGFIGVGLRSSMKNINMNKSPVSRTFSLDSPKKLRFAKLEPLGGSISNNNTTTGVVPEDLETMQMAPAVKLTVPPSIGESAYHERFGGIQRNSCPCIQNALHEDAENDHQDRSGRVAAGNYADDVGAPLPYVPKRSPRGSNTACDDTVSCHEGDCLAATDTLAPPSGGGCVPSSYSSSSLFYARNDCSKCDLLLLDDSVPLLSVDSGMNGGCCDDLMTDNGRDNISDDRKSDHSASNEMEFAFDGTSTPEFDESKLAVTSSCSVAMLESDVNGDLAFVDCDRETPV